MTKPRKLPRVTATVVGHLGTQSWYANLSAEDVFSYAKEDIVKEDHTMLKKT